MVTGSVGLLFVRTCAVAEPAGTPKVSVRLRRTNEAASAANCSATARKSSGKVSVTLLSQHNPAAEGRATASVCGGRSARREKEQQ